jgi:hypothetical protein
MPILYHVKAGVAIGTLTLFLAFPVGYAETSRVLSSDGFCLHTE